MTCVSQRLNKIRHWMIGPPLVVGLGLAFAGLPFYGSIVLFCHIHAPPFAESWASQVTLLFIPVFGSIFFTTVAMTMICHKVYKQSQASDKCRFRKGKTNMIKNEEMENHSSSWGWTSWQQDHSRGPKKQRKP
jgi:hypothetical protein